METATPMSPNEIAVFLGVMSVLGLVGLYLADKYIFKNNKQAKQ